MTAKPRLKIRHSSVDMCNVLVGKTMAEGILALRSAFVQANATTTQFVYRGHDGAVELVFFREENDDEYRSRMVTNQISAEKRERGEKAELKRLKELYPND